MFRTIQSGRATDLWVRSMNAEGTASPLLSTEFGENNPNISLDGRWLAYQSNESGQFEIYVRPFPDADAARWTVSRDGGTRPLWSRDGRELFYLTLEGKLTAVPVREGPDFGEPEQLFEQTYLEGTGRTYDVSPDGQRFLMIKELDERVPAELILVQNWFSELNRITASSN